MQLGRSFGLFMRFFIFQDKNGSGDTNIMKRSGEGKSMKNFKNLREFATPLQKIVWRSFIEIFPLEYSTSQMEEGELKQSCRELYAYTTEGMIDIAEHPEAYGFIPDDRLSRYEVYCFHPVFLKNLLSHPCEKEKNSILIDNIEYDSVLAQIERKLKKIKVLDRTFPLRELLKILDYRGICIKRGETQTRITNSRYPNLFYAAALLEETASAYYQWKKRTPQQYRLLDFLSIGNEKRRFTLEDIIAPMYDDEKARLCQFIGELKKKIRLGQSYKIWYYRAADFSYKKKSLFYIWWGKSYSFEIGVCLPAADTAAYAYLLGEINKQPDAEAFKAFCYDHIKMCTGCNINCIRRNAYKKDWILFDRPMDKLIRSCEPHITAYDFSEESGRYITRLIEMTIRMIDLGLV